MPKLDIEFDGLMELLGRRLYSDPRVFIRELIQNAHDAIVMRQRIEPGFAGRIDVQTATSDRRIMVHDAGIGMDDADIEKYLARIAATSKRDGDNSADLIGQHGIGFFSAFIVASKVQVTTRKLGQTKGWRWENTGSVDYTMTPAEVAETGTTVEVFLRGDADIDLVRAETVVELVRKYADMLRIPIYIDNGRQPANTMVMPWERSGISEKEKTSETWNYVNRRMKDLVFELSTFELTLEDGRRASGALYVTQARGIFPPPPRKVFVYQSRMLLTERGSAVLPEWASFINGVIDTNILTPNAARDDFIKDNSATELCDKLEAQIVGWFERLRHDKPERFREIVQYHYLAIMSACAANEEFFGRFHHLLLWRTNKRGIARQPESDLDVRDDDEDFASEVSDERVPLDINRKAALRTLPEILDYLKPGKDGVYRLDVIADSLAVSNYFSMADARRVIVVDASDWLALEVLRKIESLANTETLGNRQIRLVQVENEDNTLVRPLPQGESQIAELATFFDRKVYTGASIVRVEAASIEPESIVALLRSGSRGNATDPQRILSDPDSPEHVKELARENIRLRRHDRVKLILNGQSPLIRDLARAWAEGRPNGQEPSQELAARFLTFATAIFHVALMNSHQLLGENAQATIGTQLGNMMSAFLAADRQAQANKSQVTILQSDVDRLRAQLAPKVTTARPDNELVTLFTMTPFKSDFDGVRAALKNVMVNKFGVRLIDATDERRDGLLLSNLRKHISETDGFIADVTGGNPNVMMELGAVLLTDNPRPVICITRDDKIDDLPADIRGLVHVQYSKVSDENLESFFEVELRKDKAFMALVGQAKARMLSEAQIRAWLADWGIDLPSNEVRRLCERFPTDTAWTNADVLGVEEQLSGLNRVQAKTVLKRVQEGIRFAPR